MGIFDKFFKNKKIIEQAVENAVDGVQENKKAALENEAENDKTPKSDECVDEGSVKAAKIRGLAKQYLPGNISSVYCQRKMFELLTGILKLPEEITSGAEGVFEKLKSGELNDVRCAASVANVINNCIKDKDLTDIIALVGENENDILLKCWVVLDYYISTLKSEFSGELRRFRDSLSDVVEGKGLDSEDTASLMEIMKLERECATLQKDNTNAQELKAKRLALAESFKSLKAVFVLYDDSLGQRFPYVSFDGRVEACMRYETAVALKKHYEDKNFGVIHVKRLEKDEYIKLYRYITHMGLPFVRFDNGTFPVDIPTAFLADVKEVNIVERLNCGMRGLFLRSVLYTCCMNAVKEKIKDTEQEKKMMESVLTCKFTAFREFGNAVLYVFANSPYEKGITLYSKKALERATRLKEALKMDDAALTAPSDSEYKIYGGGMNYRVTHKGTDDAMDKSYVCVFTSRLEAEKARLYFEKFGCNDSVVAVTYEEIASQVSGCAGVMVDMLSYSLEIKKNEFPVIEKFKTAKGKITVNLKKKEQVTEENTANADGCSRVENEDNSNSNNEIL